MGSDDFLSLHPSPNSPRNKFGHEGIHFPILCFVAMEVTSAWPVCVIEIYWWSLQVSFALVSLPLNSLKTKS